MSRYLRNRAQTLETAIYTFQHPDSRGIIELIGMMDFGNQGYYDAIANRAQRTDAAGGLVHYETIDGWRQLHLDEEAAEDMRRIPEAFGLIATIIAQHTGTKSHSEAFSYQKRWQNHDITAGELVSLLGMEWVTKQLRAAEKLQALNNKYPKLAGKMVRGQLRSAPYLSPLVQWPLNRREAQVEHRRSSIAVAAVNKARTADPDQPIAMLWGPGHLPHIKKGLNRLGYKRIGVEWLGALSLRKPENIAQ